MTFTPCPSFTTRPAPALFNRVDELVGSDLARVELQIQKLLDSQAETLSEVERYLFNAGGKRVRAVLILIASRLANVPQDDASWLACAAELSHMASLHHDDLIDEATERRGRPAARIVFGGAISLLAGDLCLVRAFECAAKVRCHHAVIGLAHTITMMVEAEVRQREKAWDVNMTVWDYFQIVEGKTAALCAWSASLADIPDESLSEPLKAYGKDVGYVLQISNDIIDCIAAGEQTGRDLFQGTITLPVLLACDNRPILREQLRDMMLSRHVVQSELRNLLADVVTAKGIEGARTYALQAAERARQHLSVLPASRYRQALVEIPRRLMEQALS